MEGFGRLKAILRPMATWEWFVQKAMAIFMIYTIPID
jgi:hypothetical protein